MRYCIPQVGRWNQGTRAYKAKFRIIDQSGKPLDAEGTWSGKIQPRGKEVRDIAGTLQYVEGNIITWDFVDADDADPGPCLVQLEQSTPNGPMPTDWFELLIVGKLGSA